MPDLLEQQQHAEVGGDRVETTPVHDPGTARGRHRIEPAKGPANQEQRTGEVRLVGNGPGARLHQGHPIPGSRSYGGRDHPAGPHEHVE
jgi:hypothetical protein